MLGEHIKLFLAYLLFVWIIDLIIIISISTIFVCFFRRANLIKKLLSKAMLIELVFDELSVDIDEEVMTISVQNPL